jgi:multidrug efflux system outer membrane protein
MRISRWITLCVLALASACTMGPSTRVSSAAVPVNISRADTFASHSARVLLDSLTQARNLDRPSASAVPSSAEERQNADPELWHPIPLRLDGTRDVAWLQVLRDTQLVALVNDAVANNRDLRVARDRIREFRAQAGVARSGLFPQITASAAASHNKAALGPTVVKYDAVQVIGSLSWELDFWGRTRRGLEASQFDLRASEEDARATTISLVSDVATAYLQLRELDEDVRITEETLASRRTTLDIARRRYRQGVTSELDVRLFEADLADPGARLADLAQLRAQAETRLSQLLGRAPGSITRGRPLEEIVQSVAAPDSIPAALIAQRPDVLAAQHIHQASLARVGQSIAARLPTIAASAQYGAQHDEVRNLFGRDHDIYTLQLGFSVPVFDGSRLENEERVARARADQARGQYEQTVVTALRESADALTGVQLGRAQLVARATQVQALRSAYSMAEQRYGSGVSSYLEVLDAQRQLFGAQLTLVQTERQYLVSTVDLYRALGGGWNAASH